MNFVLGIIIATIVVVFVAFVIKRINSQKEAKRREQFSIAAEEMGLQFVPEVSKELLEYLAVFKLMNRGYGRKLRNLIRGDLDEVSISIFDYRYTESSGEDSITYDMTVSTVRVDGLKCPEFSIRPETLMDKAAGLLGFKDINFASHPKFSRMYYLEGADEEAIREFMRTDLLEFLEDQREISVEGNQDTLLYYRKGIKVNPEKLKDFLGEAFQLYTIVAKSNEAPSENG